MDNPTQDSQSELDDILLTYSSSQHDATYEANDKLGENSHNEAKQAIQSIIRTEKLKLLAEVRERVVGEDESPESIPPTMSAEYHNYVHAQNKLRDEQRYSLTKLEAEL